MPPSSKASAGIGWAGGWVGLPGAGGLRGAHGAAEEGLAAAPGLEPEPEQWHGRPVLEGRRSARVAGRCAAGDGQIRVCEYLMFLRKHF